VSSSSHNVLFICTGNSARSIMAEALLNWMGQGRFKAYSAGSHPAGVVNPSTLVTLKELHLPTDGLRSKDWDEFARPDAPQLDFVITVCDQAAGEACPVWPGHPITAHWGVPDPAAFDGPEDRKAKVFLDTALALRKRIELMLALPLDRLDHVAIRREVKGIGTR
jgi:arsenate reductase